MSVDRVVDSRCIRCGRRAMEKKTATAWRVPTAIVRAAIEGAGLPDESRNVVYIEHWELWEGLRVVAYVERVGERWWCSTCADRALEVRNEHVAEGFPALTVRRTPGRDDMMRFTVNEGGTAPDGWGFVPMKKIQSSDWTELHEPMHVMALWPAYHAVSFTEAAPCPGCGISVVLPVSNRRKAHYCSEKCRKAPGVTARRAITCQWCEKRLTGRRRKYCSDRCADKDYNRNQRKHPTSA